MKFASRFDLGILGEPDSPELWQEIVGKIDIKPNMKFLNVACGHGTEAKVLAKALVNSGYYTKEQALDAIYLIDKYKMFTEHAKFIGFKNAITDDFLTWEPKMKFDVVFGNPPYQSPTDSGERNIGAPLWPKFISKSMSVLKPGGVMSFITPATWFSRSDRGAWGEIKKHNLTYVNPDVEHHFKGVGSTFCYFILEKSSYGGKTELSTGGFIDFHNDPIPTNNSQLNIASVERLKTLLAKCVPLDVKSGPVDPSINSDHWSNTQTKTHQYETYYSGRSDRKSIWCDRPIGDHGKLKLVVPNNFWGNFEPYVEITTKGVGRQAYYVLGTEEELLQLKDWMLSADSLGLTLLMAAGRFTNSLKYIVRGE